MSWAEPCHGSVYYFMKQPVAFLYNLYSLPLLFLSVSFRVIPPLLWVRWGLAYCQACCGWLFGTEQLNWVEFWLWAYTMRQWDEGFGMEDREVSVWFPNVHLACVCLNYLSVALTSAGFAAFWLCYRLTLPHGLFPVLWLWSILFVIFICCFPFLPWAFDICMLSHTKSSWMLGLYLEIGYGHFPLNLFKFKQYNPSI
jgi:hypothetical protein